MREILFRGKTELFGNWIEGSLIIRKDLKSDKLVYLIATLSASKGRNTGLFVAMSVIKNKEALPNADVVKVVRCKYCVYWECRGYNGRCEACHNGLIRDYTNYDDFCSYGEKRSEEEWLNFPKGI